MLNYVESPNRSNKGPVLHTENVAGGGGQTECFENVGGGKGVYDVLTSQKSRGGARAHLGGAKAP